MSSMTPVWSKEQLKVESDKAVGFFRFQRIQEPLEAYLERLDHYRGVMENLVESTVDLVELEQQALDIIPSPDLFFAFRYLPGPPISEDDLRTVADARFSAKSLKSDPAMVKRIFSVIKDGMDRRRFPWLSEDREPTECERYAAILSSAVLLAKAALETSRRSTGKQEQERRVQDALLECGLTMVPTRTISTLTDAPKPGEFCGESRLGTRKADFVVRLYDNRVMALECKVSNSSTNSVKRLNNDAAAKAVVWHSDFGKLHVVPAAVLSGVYKLKNLQEAQERGLGLFWAHDLDQLKTFVDSTKRS